MLRKPRLMRSQSNLQRSWKVKAFRSTQCVLDLPLQILERKRWALDPLQKEPPVSSGQPPFRMMGPQPAFSEMGNCCPGKLQTNRSNMSKARNIGASYITQR